MLIDFHVVSTCKICGAPIYGPKNVPINIDNKATKYTLKDIIQFSCDCRKWTTHMYRDIQDKAPTIPSEGNKNV